MRELLIRFLWWTLPADAQLELRLHYLKEPSMDAVLMAQDRRYNDATDEESK